MHWSGPWAQEINELSELLFKEKDDIFKIHFFKIDRFTMLNKVIDILNNLNFAFEQR